MMLFGGLKLPHALHSAQSRHLAKARHQRVVHAAQVCPVYKIFVLVLPLNQPDPFAAALALMFFPDEHREKTRMRTSYSAQSTARANGELKKQDTDLPFHAALSRFERAGAFPNK